MSNILCLRICFLDPSPSFHGRTDGGEAEWPPSPLRAFQALVDAAGSHWRKVQFDDYAKPSFIWLEKLEVHSIVTPIHHLGTPFRIAVPNNDLDVWAGPISKGNEPRKQQNDLKAMKTVLPVHLRGKSEDENAVHFLYSLPEGEDQHLSTLQAAARSITHLGWGVDMVSANVEVLTMEQVAKLTGHVWRPVLHGGTPLRVPIVGTLEALQSKYAAVMDRLSGGGFKPVPPLSVFNVVGYHCPTVGGENLSRQMAAFELHKTIAEQDELPAGKSKFRSFDTARFFGYVAGMVRHAAAHVASVNGWNKVRIDSFIHGHGVEKEGQATSDDRLMFLPLPSITPMGVEAVRRVLVFGPPGPCPDLTRLRQLLNGADLIDRDKCRAIAMLSYTPNTDRHIQAYTGESCTWSTVTPVMLPGYDDPDGLRKKLRDNQDAAVQRHLLERLDCRVLALIHKAFEHAGLSRELVRSAEIEYRSVGFRAGVGLANQYQLPPLHYPRYHVRVRFAHPVKGPLAVGAGRYRGLGLFAMEGRT